ncbi:MAG: molybdopterin adenylyltransferase [Methylophilaceae bacterium]|nr:molybdopterin adenylyltransferase [Methylophilaceae bacterium]MBL6728153.1 molybdopterin adenylyltransferase [Methylophilaceae bacterium]MBL6791100.1 molybdopterin adenylyltransferase [Methylophilaceae bacterium]
MQEKKFIKIGLISISDRASQGIYEDKGLPSLKTWLQEALKEPFDSEESIIPDEYELITKTLVEFIDKKKCELIFTTGGTGPSKRDVTPEATVAIADKTLPGFGEQMRQISLNFVPTAILSRQIAVIRKNSLVINLPGQPKAIKQTLEGLKDAENNTIVPGIFAAIPYCLDLIGGTHIDTHESIVKSFRPKK